jgi:hypothetical protein
MSPIHHENDQISVNSSANSEVVNNVANRLHILFPEVSPGKVHHALVQADGDAGRATAALRVYQYSKGDVSIVDSPKSSGMDYDPALDFESAFNMLQERFPDAQAQDVSNALRNSLGDAGVATAALRIARTRDFGQQFGTSVPCNTFSDSDSQNEDLDMLLDRFRQLFPDMSPRRIYRVLQKVDGHVPRAKAALRVIQRRRDLARLHEAKSASSSPLLEDFEDDTEVQTLVKQLAALNFPKHDNGLIRKATAASSGRAHEGCLRYQTNTDSHSASTALRALFKNVLDNENIVTPSPVMEKLNEGSRIRAQIWALRCMQPQSEIAPQPIVTYPCGVAIDIGELAKHMEHLEEILSSDLSRLLEICERGLHMKTALQSFEVHDADHNGYLVCQNGQLYDFVKNLFVELILPPPSKYQVRIVARQFCQHLETDSTSVGSLEMRECLCVVDALIQALTFRSRIEKFKPAMPCVENVVHVSAEEHKLVSVASPQAKQSCQEFILSPSVKSFGVDGILSTDHDSGEAMSPRRTDTTAASSTSSLRCGDSSSQVRRIAYRSIIPPGFGT